MLVVLFSFLAVLNFALAEWTATKRIAKWLWSIFKFPADWKKFLRLELLFSVGWLGMTQLGEYDLGLACLCIFCFGLLSYWVQSHWSAGLSFLVVFAS
jgi:hypothetical protein